MFDTLSSSMEHIRAGRLRALGVMSGTRLDVLPDIPTVAGAVPGYEASIWFGIGVPKSTPPEIIMRLNREINAGLANPRLKARLAELGGAPLTGSPADFGKFIASGIEKWGKVIRTAHIKGGVRPIPYVPFRERYLAAPHHLFWW